MCFPVAGKTQRVRAKEAISWRQRSLKSWRSCDAGFQCLYGDRLAQMVLFGSQARGDEGAASDIDVLVILSGEVTPGEEIARTGPITAVLSLQNDVVISCVFMSSERWEREKSPLLLNARREGVPV